jgi:hypothetical protein
MGYGTYSSVTRSARAASLNYATASQEELFTQKSLTLEMNPMNVGIRESRDSDAHPVSVPIIINLDVTGSMGNVPHQLVKDGLPTIMETIIEAGIEHPQVLFAAVGDHTCDQAPYQISQFESDDELLDKWLTDVYLEGNGGGNTGESYLLAWYAAAHHTSHDHMDKRGKKGYLFTIGDEPTLQSVGTTSIRRIFGGQGSGSEVNYSAQELLEAARENYHVHHLHITETGAGRNTNTQSGWKSLMGDENVTLVQSHTHVASTIAKIVTDIELQGAAQTAPTQTDTAQEEKSEETIL